MLYKEDRVSRQLFDINKEYLMFLWDSTCLNQKGIDRKIYKIWGYIHRLWERKIKHRELYDYGVFFKKTDYKYIDEYTCAEIPKVAVYTCISGGYDNLNEPLFVSDKCDFYVITDNNINTSSKWKKIEIEKEVKEKYKDDIMINRYYKMNPHLLFKNYDISIYIDGNITVVADVLPLALQLPKKCFFGVHKHPDRKTISSEGRAVDYFNKVKNKMLLNKQLFKYYNDGFDDSVELLEATVLVRKHNDPRCIKIMKRWWDEYCSFPTRDQISLPYVIWKENSIDGIYCYGNDFKLNPRFLWNRHVR